MKTRNLVSSVCSSCLLTVAPAYADFASERLANWHQWRGPNADGVAVNADPPLEWSEEKNVKWKVPVPGKGHSSPVVWNDRIFVMTAIETDRQAESAARAEPAAEAPRAQRQEQPRGQGGRGSGGFGGRGGRGGDRAAPKNYFQFAVICFDRATGEIKWQRVCAEAVPHEPGQQTNTFASGSPVTDGERVFVNFGSRGTYCYDMDGNPIWQQDLGDMQTRNGFGEGCSPALHGDTLVVPWDHEGDSSVYALNASTGDILWQAPRNEVTTWATPLIIEAKGRTQVVLNGSNRVVSYDLANGDVLWQCGGQAANPIPSPLRRDGLVYCVTGYRGNAVYAIPLDASGDITDTDKVAWSTNETGSYVATPVLHDGLLYVTHDRNAILSCFDAKTGEKLYGPARIPGMGQATVYSSLVAADDRIFVTDRDGTTVVIKHGPEMDVLATNQLGEGIDASPAIVGKQMFIRGAEHLYCIEAQ